ncbi:MAG TPA: hypothetical protein VLZ74_16285 [Methylocella sp.]|nr:hypothetical protein [Methylocella sp.]
MHISDRLLELGTFYNREARRCVKSKSYLAAAIMQVSALEAALQAMCFMYPAEVKRTTVFQRKRFKGKRYRALEFSLYELINIADELVWFLAKKINWGKRTTLAGFTHEIRKLRNFVHPGVWAREHAPTKFSKETYGVIIEVFDVATSWLVHRVHQGLYKRMQKEGLV